jgi:hypothetical protein
MRKASPRRRPLGTHDGHGAVVKRGSHDALLLRNGRYAELIQRQLKSDTGESPPVRACAVGMSA